MYGFRTDSRTPSNSTIKQLDVQNTAKDKIMGTFFGLFNIQIQKMRKTAKPIILIHLNTPSLYPVDHTINSPASPGTLYKYQIPVIKMPGSAISFQQPNTLTTLSFICLPFTNNLIGNATS